MCGIGIPRPKRGPVAYTCSSACKQRLYRLKKAKPVTPYANIKKPVTPPSDPAYTASDIVIMGDAERMANPIFDWELAQQLAENFCRPVAWIERGIAACRDAGTPPQYFIDRYLHRMLIPMNIGVDQSFRNLLWDQVA